MWLSNLSVVLADQTLPQASICVEDGHIAEIRPGPAPQGSKFSGSELIAIPGIVDLHGDMIEREIEPRPGSQFPVDIALLELDKRLAAAGVTTHFAALSFAEFTRSDASANALRVEEVARNIVQTINRLRSSLLTDVRIHARFEITYPNAVPVLEALIEEDQLHLISLMDHTPGQGQFRDLEAYVSYMTNWLKAERAEVEATVRQLMAGHDQAIHNLREVSALARQHGVVLASHDDDTVEKVELMADVQTVISEFPITADAARAAKARGMVVAMGAPNALRGGSHSGNLSAKEVLQAGLLDALMTDYYPAAPLHAAFAWAQQGLLPLHAAVNLIAANPARAAGLTDRGALEPGQRADIVLIRPGLTPRVVATLCAGRFVFCTDPALYG